MRAPCGRFAVSDEQIPGGLIAAPASVLVSVLIAAPASVLIVGLIGDFGVGACVRGVVLHGRWLRGSGDPGAGGRGSDS
ncbi:hypothetical protein [Streptomyces noursei]|uniref:hypothetical protein n=1 Tax=Streptomyces noursei TaxID=1971 RepID=UPI0033EAA8C5